MEIQTVESCENCKFFMPEPSNMQVGRCRRFPRQRNVTVAPDALGHMQIVENCDFPQAARNDFCGEFKPAQMRAAAGTA